MGRPGRAWESRSSQLIQEWRCYVLVEVLGEDTPGLHIEKTSQ